MKAGLMEGREIHFWHCSIERGAMREQRRHDLYVTTRRCVHEGRQAAAVDEVWVYLAVQQQHNRIVLLMLNGCEECRRLSFICTGRSLHKIRRSPADVKQRAHFTAVARRCSM
jgi:hypothetical protein